MLVSLTRLRLKSVTGLFKFLRLSGEAIRQAQADLNCLGGAVYIGPGLTFWTATVWSDEPSMRAYVMSGAHRITMPHLSGMCSEGATTHYSVSAAQLPKKEDVVERIRISTRWIPVRNPSANQELKLIPAKGPWQVNVFKAPAQ